MELKLWLNEAMFSPYKWKQTSFYTFWFDTSYRKDWSATYSYDFIEVDANKYRWLNNNLNMIFFPLAQGIWANDYIQYYFNRINWWKKTKIQLLFWFEYINENNNTTIDDFFKELNISKTSWRYNECLYNIYKYYQTHFNSSFTFNYKIQSLSFWNKNQPIKLNYNIYVKPFIALFEEQRDDWWSYYELVDKMDLLPDNQKQTLASYLNWFYKKYNLIPINYHTLWTLKKTLGIAYNNEKENGNQLFFIWWLWNWKLKLFKSDVLSKEKYYDYFSNFWFLHMYENLKKNCIDIYFLKESLLDQKEKNQDLYDIFQFDLSTWESFLKEKNVEHICYLIKNHELYVSQCNWEEWSRYWFNLEEIFNKKITKHPKDKYEKNDNLKAIDNITITHKGINKNYESYDYLSDIIKALNWELKTLWIIYTNFWSVIFTWLKINNFNLHNAENRFPIVQKNYTLSSKWSPTIYPLNNIKNKKILTNVDYFDENYAITQYLLGYNIKEILCKLNFTDFFPNINFSILKKKRWKEKYIIIHNMKGKKGLYSNDFMLSN